ncbi:hypothetical protein [Sporosarcina sp. SAFN-015]|uniref:hypothetical protein n=1 Tax=Sporosarcina sp. SAFN-015 TaxID=3387274 RepID=UPI003F7ED366
MECVFIDPYEMELRRDPDFIASLEMIDEGSPVHYPNNDRKPKLREASGFDASELPQTYQ